MNEEVEVESTYLAREVPAEIAGVEPIRLFDMYLASDDPKLFDVRLRNRGDKYEITKKRPLKPGDFSTSTELTIWLDKTEFDALCKADGRVVEKDRYKVAIAGLPAEVDVFTGELTGLVWIDFEFLDEAARQQFKPPACCLADVTQEFTLLGGQLAGKRYRDIAKTLEKFAYKPLHR